MPAAGFLLQLFLQANLADSQAVNGVAIDGLTWPFLTCKEVLAIVGQVDWHIVGVYEVSDL